MIGIVIQCRDTAARYKEKSVRIFYKGKSILEIIIDKFKYLSNKVVVATEPKSLKTIEICKKTNTECVTGSEDDVLARIYETACAFDFNGIFRVCADNPFIQLPLMYPVESFAKSGQYDYVAFKNCMRRHEGFFMEYISVRTLGDVYSLCPPKYDREHVTPYIINHPKRYYQKILPIPEIMNLIPIRLTVDTASDFMIARKVYNHIDERHWSYIYGYVQNNPEILKEMKKNIEGNPK